MPPHDPHPPNTGDIVQDPTPPATTDRDDPARGTTRRHRRARDRDRQNPVVPLDSLNMDPVEAEQQVTARARAGSGARRSAPRSRVKHVEVLGIDQTVSATDPRGPRPLPANHHPARLTPTECPKSLFSDCPQPECDDFYAANVSGP
ncbi:hypothetical protein ACFPRL_01090 [Pseudoclavibacter helvolus]